MSMDYLHRAGGAAGLAVTCLALAIPLPASAVEDISRDHHHRT